MSRTAATVLAVLLAAACTGRDDAPPPPYRTVLATVDVDAAVGTDVVVHDLTPSPVGAPVVLVGAAGAPQSWLVDLDDDGTATAVEMRGAEIRGVLGDGDRVVIDPPPAGGDGDGVLRPRRLRNQTTTSLVSAWEPPLYARVGGKFATLLISTAISTVVASTIGLIFGGGSPEGERAPPAGAGSEDGTDWFPFVSPLALVEVLGLSAIIWGVWFAAFGRRGRRRGRVIWPVALGISLGVTIGLWVVALLADFEVG